MDVVSLSYLYVLMVMVAREVTRTAGDCIPGSKVIHRPFSETIVNHTLVGPVMSNITANNERECEMECHLAVPPDKCYMFNYHPSSKVCELLYKDRAAEYKVEKKKGSIFKTRQCASCRSCRPSQNCVALGDQENTLCLNFTGRVVQANTDSVCFGAKDDIHGTFFAPSDGKIKTIKLVYVSGDGIFTKTGSRGFWGTVMSPFSASLAEVHVTDNQNIRITPPQGYPVNSQYGLRYNVTGSTVMSPEFVFPNICPPLAVWKGKEFRIWVGQDLVNNSEHDNKGTTCADVHVFFTE